VTSSWFFLSTLDWSVSTVLTQLWWTVDKLQCSLRRHNGDDEPYEYIKVFICVVYSCLFGIRCGFR